MHHPQLLPHTCSCWLPATGLADHPETVHVQPWPGVGLICQCRVVVGSQQASSPVHVQHLRPPSKGHTHPPTHPPTQKRTPPHPTWKASTLGIWLLQVVESTLKSFAAPGQKVASKAMKRSLGLAYLGAPGGRAPRGGGSRGGG
jgi:hypothetical protein